MTDTPTQSQVSTASGGDFAALLARATALAVPGKRRLLGITGAPGAGKSTLAARLVDALGERAVLAPMDGFHLANEELDRLSRHQRKGAVDTFDAGGYVSLLTRLRHPGPYPVYAPTFRRDLEEAIAGAIRVDPDVPLVITEGNYLLVTDGEWAGVRPQLDEVWFLEPAEDVRMGRLVDRHMQFGRDLQAALARAAGSDQANAELIQATRNRADLVLVGS